ncbi:MAG: 4-hydroxy-tetrahydrodipicolinate reductase [Myxococcota bacterium]
MEGARRVLVVGALGRMGARVRAALSDEPTLRLGAALEAPGHSGLGTTVEDGVRVGDDVAAALESADIAIDFTVPAATLANLHAAADAGVAYVTGTTGFTEAQHAEIAGHTLRIPIVHAPNFSLAVNVLAWLTREAARLLGPSYDAEIVELHHAAKRDAPSGTALRLGEAIALGRDQKLAEHLVLARAGDIGPRPDDAIGIQALRAGDSPGEHSVIFAGPGERLELIHRSHTRDHFARGAVRAAAWLPGHPPGLYRIEEVLGLD